MDRRLTESTSHGIGLTPTTQTIGLKQSWCTGKDSNLRTSLGGTDLQSVGFNHSPTCAKLSGDAAAALVRRTIPMARPPKNQNHQPDTAMYTALNLQSAQTGFATRLSPGFEPNWLNLNWPDQGTKDRAASYRAKITTRRKTSEWSGLEKPVAPKPAAYRYRFLTRFSGAGEGI